MIPVSLDEQIMPGTFEYAIGNIRMKIKRFPPAIVMIQTPRRIFANAKSSV